MIALALVCLGLVLGVSTLVGSNLRRHYRPAPAAERAPRVSILIPARNEADNIEAAVRAACAQSGEVEVVVLDDGSTDATPAILAGLAARERRLRVVRGVPLPPGWTGKSWACWQLAQHARHQWLMFVDADVRLAPDAAARAVSASEAQEVDLLSGVPRQHLGSPGEALVVPMIHLVLLAWLPMALIRRRPEPALSAACGQLMVVRSTAYRASGGHGATPATLHDGIMLARRLKATGHTVGLVDATDLATCRMYVGMAATWRGFSRNAYEALGSPGALAVMTALNLGAFVAPFVGLAVAAARGQAAAAAVFAVASAAVVVLRAALAARFHHPRWTALATPLAVIAMVAIQIHSFLNHCTGRRIPWRAREYAPAGTVAADERTV